jgi:hypothetical protein
MPLLAAGLEILEDLGLPDRIEVIPPALRPRLRFGGRGLPATRTVSGRA